MNNYQIYVKYTWKPADRYGIFEVKYPLVYDTTTLNQVISVDEYEIHSIVQKWFIYDFILKEKSSKPLIIRECVIICNGLNYDHHLYDKFIQNYISI